MNLWLIIAVIHTKTVVCVTAMINHKFISFSEVQIYDISYIHLQTNKKLERNK